MNYEASFVNHTFFSCACSSQRCRYSDRGRGRGLCGPSVVVLEEIPVVSNIFCASIFEHHSITRLYFLQYCNIMTRFDFLKCKDVGTENMGIIIYGS